MRPDPHAPSGVYLYGYYGQGNIGDDLLMESAVGMIRSLRPLAPIHVHCHDPDRLPVFSNAGALIPVPANRILSDQSMGKPRRFAAYLAAVDRALSACDTFVFGGGTVFQDRDGPASLLVIMATVLAARRRGLRVIMLGSGVAPLGSLASRAAMGRILGAADAVCVRDEASLGVCRAIRASAPLQLTGDLAYALRTGKSLERRAGGPPHVLLSIQPAVTDRDTPDGERARQALRTVIADTLTAGGTCALLALEVKAPGEGGMDDIAAWGRTAAGFLAEASDRVRLLPLAGSLDRIDALLGEATVHAGMRYHAHVIAALRGTPFAGLAHDVKITEVCRAFDMPCHAVATVDAEAFAGSVRQAAGRAIRAAALDGQRSGAMANLEALRDVMAAA
jgi:polysaccharide pyruvyl transferase WcaK-like protein